MVNLDDHVMLTFVAFGERCAFDGPRVNNGGGKRSLVQGMGQALAAVDVTGEDRGKSFWDLRAGNVVWVYFEGEITWADFCSLKGLMHAQKVGIGFSL